MGRTATPKRPNKSKEIRRKCMGTVFMRAADVARELGVSKSHAYKIVRKLNAELQEMGYLTVSGRVSTKYFLEKVCYGTKERKD